jgi:1,2-diacylglycerol 3-alpha-glucosyltransferase
LLHGDAVLVEAFGTLAFFADAALLLFAAQALLLRTAIIVTAIVGAMRRQVSAHQPRRLAGAALLRRTSIIVDSTRRLPAAILVRLRLPLQFGLPSRRRTGVARSLLLGHALALLGLLALHLFALCILAGLCLADLLVVAATLRLLALDGLLALGLFALRILAHLGLLAGALLVLGSALRLLALHGLLALGLRALRILVRLRLLAGALLVLGTALRLLALHGLLALGLRALCILASLRLLALHGLRALCLASLLRALRVLVRGARLGGSLFLVVALTVVVLRASGASAKRKRCNQRERPQGLLSVGGFHVGFPVGCQYPSIGLVPTFHPRDEPALRASGRIQLPEGVNGSSLQVVVGCRVFPCIGDTSMRAPGTIRSTRRMVAKRSSHRHSLAGMDLLMLSDVYFPRVNGVSTSIRTFAEWLARAGHRVTLVVPDYGDPAQGAHDGNGAYEVIRLPSRGIFFDPEDRLIRGSALRRLLPLLARRRWDAIHIHTPFRAHQLGVRLAGIAGLPTVETYHTYFEEYIALYLPWLPPALLRMFARRASRRLCHDVDHLIVPSRELVGVLEGYGITTPNTVLPTGIELREFSGGSGERFRRQHGIAPDRPVLVTVSRLAMEKNIDFLLRVVQRLLPEFPDLLFVIAGEGPDAARLEKLAGTLGLQDNVRFFGNLDRRTALLDCYRAGDVFVFASPTETQGLVLIEAMALGVPIVSTAVMGTATVLRDARSARTSNADEHDFAGNIAHLLRTPAERAALSAAGPRDAAAWSTDRLMARVVALYERLRDGAGHGAD